jgi:RNA polymerase sigma factor (sigma-70 family)
VREAEHVLDHIRACAAGDAAARRAFQDRFAEDIYNFPVKIYGLPADQAADFYLYVFERDRIFTRLRTFEGRNAIQLRTFLAYYVLRSLFFEWQRSRRELDTVSLGEPVGDSTTARTLEDVLPHPEAAAADASPSGEPGPASRLWAGLTPQERLDLKLLSLLEQDLGPDDLTLLARLSGRPLRETVAMVAEVLDALRAKDTRLSALRDQLDAIWGWIVLRRRELQETDEKLRLMGSDHGSQAGRQLVARRQRLEEAVAKRVQQRERLLEEMRRHKVTTPYKDIARLLGTTVGTVCSRMSRLRQRLEERWPAPEEAS